MPGGRPRRQRGRIHRIRAGCAPGEVMLRAGGEGSPRACHAAGRFMVKELVKYSYIRAPVIEKASLAHG